MISCLVLISLLIHATAQVPLKPPTSNKKWLTLNGQPPLVVARGGFSGVFPESTDFAIDMTLSSVSNVVMLCNLQLTKDGKGICQPDVRINNTTNIDMVYPNNSKTYNVNGKDVTGWFSVDFTFEELLSNVTVMQSILTRPSDFDNQLPVTPVDDVLHGKFHSYWINVQYDKFYTEHKLNVASYIQTERAFRRVDYISSPEIGFLKSLNGKVSRRTKLIFVFLDKNAIEPTTNQTYGSILQNLATIKSFASGIAVPKDYIWPVTKANYLEKNATSLVLDAHKLGLEVYASGFANDYVTVFDYFYDPAAEYLQFIDNKQFAIDGIITDFPSTASAALACFANFSDVSMPRKDGPLIITYNGASGVYAGCTDLAYQRALDDGADIIDCTVQMSKDGVAFCMDSADLTGDTTAMTTFVSRSSTIPEIQPAAGIFSFDLTWTEIQTLRPQLVSPLGNGNLFPRNPASKNAGKFMTLPEFLDFAKTKAASGILINIENAAFLAAKKGLDIVTAVTTALSNATFDKQATQQVLIQSDDTSVLSKFLNIPAYKRVLYLGEEISAAPKKSVDEIKKFADAVNLPRTSLVPTNNGYAVTTTNVVHEMHAANLTVYVSLLRNEFATLPFDFFSDPTVEIATYIAGLEADGIITEYPATASRYLRNVCSNLNYDLPFTVLPIEPPLLLQFINSEMLPPAAAPSPVLDVADVVDPPLPAVAKTTDTSSSGSPAPTTPPSAATANIANLGATVLATMVLLGLLSKKF
ncbi:glycerophosphoryl diester phosphodiesterase, putative [Ricinus communis]|uniref:glycerophosphodiester phosphodiesterase n=1 Tax=Ricinus communis TaxID=3988 RepID=B9SBY4_RICCO|nr:glycerophosphoryl diester phosphodiesterase, putative [Ricinus communis]|eukprot:XP_002523503.1 glycerophosphodiester phosphodiesterase GDPDL6 [Ricinus communis]